MSKLTKLVEQKENAMSRTKVFPFSPKLDIDYDALPHSMAGPYLIAKPGRKKNSYTGLRWKFKVPKKIDSDVFSKDAVVIDFTKRRTKAI